MLRYYFFILFLFCLSSLKANHIAGSEVTYQWLNNEKYEFTAKVYRNCKDISLSSINSELRSGSTSFSVTMKRISITDITPVCGSTSKPCSPSNTTVSAEGLEEHIYVATIDFGISPYNYFRNNNLCKVLFEINFCCIGSPHTSCDFSNMSMLDVCMLKMENRNNNSPVFANKPLRFLCCNNPIYFDPGVYEKDEHDSFAFEIDNSQCTIGNNISVLKTMPITPYCPGTIPCTANPSANPPQGFYFRTTTGEFVVTPTDCSQNIQFCIKVTEFRKDSNSVFKEIGYVRKDIKANVSNCGANYPPIISGGNATVCAGEKVCITIKGTDKIFAPYQTKADTVTLSWNNSIPGATLNITDTAAREKTAEFCWQTKPEDASLTDYRFSVFATDNYCPMRSSSSKCFTIKVKSTSEVEMNNSAGSCGFLRFKIKPVKFTDNFTTYLLELYDSLNPGKIIFATISLTDSFQVPKGGSYIAKLTINNPKYCAKVVYDTLRVKRQLASVVNYPHDTLVCYGTSASMTALPQFGTPPYKFRWTKNNAFTAGDTSNKLSLVFTKDTFIRVLISDAVNCELQDLLKIRVRQLPKLSLGPDKRICSYDTYFLGKLFPDTLNYLWKPGNETTKSIQLKKTGQYSLVFKDPLGCTNYDTIEFFINDTVKIYTRTDTALCKGTGIVVSPKIKPQGFFAKKFIWKEHYLPTPIIYDSFYAVTPKENRRYSVKLFLTQEDVTCEARDTFFLKVKQLPAISSKPKDHFCANIDEILNDAINPNPPDVKISADSAQLIKLISNRYLFQMKTLPPSVQKMRFFLNYKDSLSGCENNDTLSIAIKHPPIRKCIDQLTCNSPQTYNLSQMLEKPDLQYDLNYEWKEIFPNKLIERSFNSGTPTKPNWILLKGPILGTDSVPLLLQTTDLSSGCIGRDTCFLRFTDYMSYKALPVKLFCADDSSFSLKNSVTLNGFLTNHNLIWTCTDKNENIIPSMITDDTLLVIGKNIGRYTLTVHNPNESCSGVDSIPLFVMPRPVINIGRDTTITSEQYPWLNVEGQYNYLWNDSTKFHFHLVDPVKLGPGKHIMWLRATDRKTGCKTTDSIEITVLPDIVGISTEESEFKIYPNPASAIVNLMSSIEIKTVQLYNSSGKEVFNGKFKGKQIKLNLVNLNSGAYRIRIGFVNLTYSEKILFIL